MSRFLKSYDVRFQHCDPAGLIFYPRAFEILNDVIMDWFCDVTGSSIAALIGTQRVALPTVKVCCEFRAPTRLGDRLDMALTVRTIGRSSIGLVVIGSCGAEERMVANSDLVYVSLASPEPRATPFPEPLRARLTTYLDVGSA